MKLPHHICNVLCKVQKKIQTEQGKTDEGNKQEREVDKNDNGYNGSKRKITNAEERNRRENYTQRDNREKGNNEENKNDMIPNVDNMQLKIHDEKWRGREKKEK